MFGYQMSALLYYLPGDPTALPRHIVATYGWPAVAAFAAAAYIGCVALKKMTAKLLPALQRLAAASSSGVSANSEKTNKRRPARLGAAAALAAAFLWLVYLQTPRMPAQFAEGPPDSIPIPQAKAPAAKPAPHDYSDIIARRRARRRAQYYYRYGIMPPSIRRSLQ